jgi:hypothetical protein
MIYEICQCNLHHVIPAQDCQQMQNVATSPRVAGRGGGPGYLIETDWADRACVLDHLIGELTVGET